jgi:hypothetical protein
MRFLAFALIAYIATQSGAVEARRAGDEFPNNSVPRNLPKPIPSTSTPSPKFSQGLFDRLSNQLVEAVKARNTEQVIKIFDAMEQQGAIPQPPRFAAVDPEFDALNRRLHELVKARDWVSVLRYVDAMTVYNKPFNKQRADALKAYRPKIEKISYYYIAPLQVNNTASGGIRVTGQTNLPEDFRLELDVITGFRDDVQTFDGIPIYRFANLVEQEKFTTVSNRRFSFKVSRFEKNPDRACAIHLGSPPKTNISFPQQSPVIIRILGRSFEFLDGPQVLKGSKHVILMTQNFSC